MAQVVGCAGAVLTVGPNAPQAWTNAVCLSLLRPPTRLRRRAPVLGLRQPLTA